MRSSLLLLILCFGVSAVSAQQLKTVTDHYLAFPTDAVHSIYSKKDGVDLAPGPELEKYRRSLIKVEDVKNGFLELRGMWEGYAEFALFKKADGTYLVASNYVECGPACGSTLFFFEHKEGKWIDVTSDVLEAPDNDEVKAALKRIRAEDDSQNLYYSLPRKGTDITLECSLCKKGNDETLFTYRWKSPKFIRK